MKQSILPGITLPEPPELLDNAEHSTSLDGTDTCDEQRPDQTAALSDDATQWAHTAQMLASFCLCELPTPASPTVYTAPAEYVLPCDDSLPHAHKPSPSFSPLPAGTEQESTDHDTAPARVSVCVVGLGLHQHTLPESLRQRIFSADVLAGGRALLDRFAEAPAERILLNAQLETAILALEQRHRAGKSVVVLADGDPLFFGIGATLARRMGRDAVSIVPAVSSLQEACARLALPWHNVECISLHGRDSFHALNVALMRNKSLCLLTDARHNPDKIVRHLLDRGVDWFDAHIFESLNTPDEKHYHLSLREVVGASFGAVSTLLLIPVRPARRPVLGIPDAALATEGSLMTKMPVRAAALSLLRVHPDHTVWDVGAGSGAVSLEASALAHEGCVMSIERDAGRALCIKENRRRFGAANLEIFTGEAPQCLHQLPTPQRIFVGGGLSGEAGQDILAALTHALPSGGRMVISCVLLGSLHLAMNYLEQCQWPMDISLVQASHTVPLAGDVRLHALNPVYLLATQKP